MDYLPDSRSFLEEKLSSALGALLFEKVYLADNKNIPDYPVMNYGHPRIIIPVTGSKILKFDSHGTLITDKLVPGDIFYSDQNIWALPVWESPHTMLSVVFANDNSYIRFLYIDDDGTRSRKGPDVFFHTFRGLPAYGIHILKSLNLLSTENTPPGAEAVHLLKALLHTALNVLENDTNISGSRKKRTFEGIKSYIDENYTYSITREDTAALFGVSTGHLSRLFREFTGESFSAYLISLKMEYAARLMADTCITVNETAYRCGYNDPGYFIRQFKKYWGRTPGTFRLE